MAKTERISWLDVAKGTSILLVVMLHATLYMREYDLASYGYEQLNTLFAPIRMPLFFAISGLLAASAVRRGFSERVGARVEMFLYLFALWTLIRWFYFGALQENIVTPEEGSTYAELLSAWIAPNTGIWFLWALAIFFAIANLAYRVRHIVFPLALIAALLAFAGIVEFDAFTQRNLFWYAPFFLGGAWYGEHLVAAITRHPVKSGLAGAVLFAALTLALATVEGLAFGAARLALSFAGLALGAAASMALAAFLPTRAVLTYLGRNTLPIYVAHVMIVAALAALFATYAGGLPLLRYWGVPVVVGLAILIAMAVKAGADRLGAAWLYAPPALPRLRPAVETSRV
ncbi:acyltransferase family protein [Acuticoccus kandeliae]|uniref:acyltransferase family protein n=1 Tax=Acuticoccus kandeliae TaxID=2073160 RepID=UPI000D3ED9C1|nr:acyltransferase family protein [Acuticoccus kandeliae]